MQIQETTKGGYSTYISRGSGAMLQKILRFICVSRERLVCIQSDALVQD